MPSLEWPMEMSCSECGRWGALAYPYPLFEDEIDFEDPDVVRGGATIGTVWCRWCSPFWGWYLLEQMSTLGARRHGGMPIEPALRPYAGIPVPEIAFLESELADFLDGPGPLTVLRPHWYGEGPIAPRSEAFTWACADLVAFMREARLMGLLYYAAVPA